MSKVHKINAVAIRKSLDRLDQIAQNHPELIDHEKASVEAWTETIKELEKMNAKSKEVTEKTISVNIRIPESMIDSIDKAQEELQKEDIPLSRAGVIRYLIGQGLKKNKLTKKD